MHGESAIDRRDQFSSRVLQDADGSVYGSSTRPKYRTEVALGVSGQRAPHDYDSSSSVSAYSGGGGPPTSPALYQPTATELMPAWRPGDGYPPPGEAFQNGVHGVTSTSSRMMQQQHTVKSQAVVTGGESTDEVDTFLVDGVVNPGHPGIPADMTLISSATLQTIRDQMSASLRRMKELEDENLRLRQIEVSHSSQLS